MGYVPDVVVSALRGSHQLGIFVRLDTDPALHVWFGVNDIPAGFDGIDPDGTVYAGGGRLIGVPSLEVLVNGTSDSVQFQLSGVDPEAGQRVIDTMPAVRRKGLVVGLTTLDDYYQPVSAPVAIWSGQASHVSEGQPPVSGDETPSTTLSLSVMSGNTARSRASRSLWSPPHQKAVSPTDRFCDNTPRLERGVAPAWPRF